MSIYSKIVLSIIYGTLVFLPGCASHKSIPHENLDSSSQLRENSQADSDKRPYVFSPAVNWSDYSSMIIDPVEVYRRPDNQFENLSEDEKNELAKYMDTEFRKTLGERFRITNKKEPRSLRLKLTLIGAETNTTMVSTFTRFDLVGMPYNVVQSIRGKEGVFIGSVSYSVEIYDATSNRLLKAFVAKQYPNAMNVWATLGTLGASKSGIEKAAEDLLAQIK